ncbi:hypothetical protein ABKV19_022942 [Rosa sericea]
MFRGRNSWCPTFHNIDWKVGGGLALRREGPLDKVLCKGESQLFFCHCSCICYLLLVNFVFYCYSDYQLSHDREIKRLGVFPAVLEKKGQEEKFNPKFGVKIRLITSFRDTCYIEILPKYRNAT